MKYFRWNDLENNIIRIISNWISLNEWRKCSLKLIWFSTKRKILYSFEKIVQNRHRVWHKEINDANTIAH